MSLTQGPCTLSLELNYNSRLSTNEDCVLCPVSRTCSVLSTKLCSGRAGTAREFSTNMSRITEQHECWWAAMRRETEMATETLQVPVN